MMLMLNDYSLGNLETSNNTFSQMGMIASAISSQDLAEMH